MTANKLILRLGLKFLMLSLVMGALLRVTLIFSPQTIATGIGFGQWIWVFVAGAINDALMTTVLLFFLWAYCISIGRWRFGKPQGYWFLGGLVALWVVLQFFAGSLVEFNKGLHRALCWIVVVWAALFALRLFVPRLRNGWSRVWLVVMVTVYLTVLVFNTVGEWFFWDEFGVRYNFIAVDYLVYTTEVVGNIRESYPMELITLGVLAVALGLEWLLFRKELKASEVLEQKGWRVNSSVLYLSAFSLSTLLLPVMAKAQDGANVYVNELQASGPYSFFTAFMKNELDYKQFYPVNTDEQVEADIAEIYQWSDSTEAQPEKLNVVLITMESMSADYMKHFGNKEDLTPVLDSLYTRGLAFNRMFAAGNRTVRGLEAVTLSRPPSPGESIIKRKENGGYPSISQDFDSLGYHTLYFYGGDSYFDNMESFFGNLGYDIVDSKRFTPSEVNFKTIWGICDEDVYHKAISTLDGLHAEGTPFYAHIMTTSNHRPYTYPEGRVRISPKKKSRKGAVMYADYALGQFFDAAARSEWFDRTIFVVLADHCASSAGSVELPLERYLIPCLIYAPNRIEPEQVDKVVSQIDVMPTVMSMLGMSADKRLYGRDVMADDYRERAFVATYQDIGYLENDTLTVLSPVRRLRQYVVTPTSENPLNLKEIEPTKGNASRRAVSLYQHASH